LKIITPILPLTLKKYIDRNSYLSTSDVKSKSVSIIMETMVGHKKTKSPMLRLIESRIIKRNAVAAIIPVIKDILFKVLFLVPSLKRFCHKPI